jgi:transcriptional regulator with XRE-family HTH domain
MEPFPEALRRLLRERGWNQSEAASQLGISQGLVSAYLRGKREPTLSTLLTVASRIGVPIGELVGEDASQRGPHEEKILKSIESDNFGDLALRNLKKRWKKKPNERGTIKHLIAALFPGDAERLLTWLEKS